MRWLLLGFALVTVCSAAGQRRSSMGVSAVVRPTARIDVLSRTAVRVRLVLARNAGALVWTARDACDMPRNAHSIPNSGDYTVNFTEADTAGQTLICLASSDGALTMSAPLLATP